ncbi:MAG: hypothetical protein GY783_21140, partial [Gammaproteobacteria bacterium]|nr:hypothetical protein [Gammaproteobacteria bacterium]
MATAVQTACVAMIPEFQAGNLTGSTLNLFGRCSELVASGDEFVGGTLGLDDLNLNLSADELNGAIQNVAGEELHSQAALTTRVTNGQFANIAGRLNALRLGSSNTAIGGRLAYADPVDDDQLSPGLARVSFDERSFTGGGAAADVAGSRIGWFLEGSFNTGDRDQTTSEDGFDFDSTSFTLGLDYLLDTGVIGASIGIDNYEA